jgi:hypothetical protein
MVWAVYQIREEKTEGMCLESSCETKVFHETMWWEIFFGCAKQAKSSPRNVQYSGLFFQSSERKVDNQTKHKEDHPADAYLRMLGIH